MDEMNNVTENVMETVKEVVVNNAWSGKEKAVVGFVIGGAFTAGMFLGKYVIGGVKKTAGFVGGIARKIGKEQPKTDENVEIVE